ncbi:hypothetical protein VTK56DRAFT_6802 [Thermocarpiscus australiensis]
MIQPSSIGSDDVAGTSSTIHHGSARDNDKDPMEEGQNGGFEAEPWALWQFDDLIEDLNAPPAGNSTDAASAESSHEHLGAALAVEAAVVAYRYGGIPIEDGQLHRFSREAAHDHHPSSSSRVANLREAGHHDGYHHPGPDSATDTYDADDEGHDRDDDDDDYEDLDFDPGSRYQGPYPEDDRPWWLMSRRDNVPAVAAAPPARSRAEIAAELRAWFDIPSEEEEEEEEDDDDDDGYGHGDFDWEEEEPLTFDELLEEVELVLEARTQEEVDEFMGMDTDWYVWTDDEAGSSSSDWFSDPESDLESVWD